MLPGFTFNYVVKFFLIIYEDSLCYNKVYFLRLSECDENK